MSRNKYEFFVRKGKKLVGDLEHINDKRNCFQAKIAKYATTVCDIRHGGTTSPVVYTLCKYADDIGVDRKTLSNWVQVYRHVLQKLNIKDPTKEEWGRARKTNEVLRQDRTIENKNNGEKGSMKAGKKNVPTEKVRDLYSNIDDRPFINECSSLIKSALHAKHVLKKRELGIVSDDKLIHLMEILDDASETINQYLTAKRRKVG